MCWGSKFVVPSVRIEILILQEEVIRKVTKQEGSKGKAIQ